MKNDRDACEAASSDGDVGHHGSRPGVGRDVVNFGVGKEGRFAVVPGNDHDLVVDARNA